MYKRIMQSTLAVFVFLLSAPVYAGDLYWPSGQRLKWGSDYYYPSGKHLLWGKDLYYPSGQHLRWGSDLYYPNGKHLRWGQTWYLPDGSEIDPYQTGRLVEIQEGDISVRVWRDRAGGLFSVSITLFSSDEWYVEYHESGKLYGARLWAQGMWHFLTGDPKVFRSSKAPHGFGTVLKPPKEKYGRKGTDFSLLGNSGSGALWLCSSEYNTLSWEKSGNAVFFLDQRKKLWLVDAGACHGGAVAEQVESFFVQGNWLFYRQKNGKVWLMTEGSYYHLASGAQDLKVFQTRSSGWGISAKISGQGWTNLQDFQIKDGIVRAYEEIPGRDIWLMPQRSFTLEF